MRNIDPALKTAFQDGRRSVIVKLETQTGRTFGYTDYDFDITIDGTTYVPAPGLQRISLTRSVNDTVSNQEFGSAWIDAPEDLLLAGEFDNAVIEIAFCDASQTGLGRMIVERGRLGIIQWTADGFRADMQSWMRDLQRTLNLVTTPTCRHKLFSQVSDIRSGVVAGACTKSNAAYLVSGGVLSTPVANLVFNVNVTSGGGSITTPASWFAGGSIEWYNEVAPSVLTNAKYMIKDSSLVSGTEHRIELYLPLPQTPISLQVKLYPGCSKTMTDCKNKFNNVVNFGGFPHIAPEIQYR
jgi:uncharacterized phage protein (TIGR02218 family)